MGSVTIPTLLVTANVGSIFEEPSVMLKTWTDEFLSTVIRLNPKFIALHCQEVGGKNYEKSMQHVEEFVRHLMASDVLQDFDKAKVFLDEDFRTPENFTALGNFYFIHESIKDVLIWDFKSSKFMPAEGKEVFSGNIEDVPIKEKAKFPKHFFPECKWSRKGFMRTRWSLNGSVFDLINIHLFHDASNFVAMEQFPSIYCRNRRRALEHTLHRFHSDAYGAAPFFLFGDFNFRTDTDGVVKKLTEGLTTTRIQNNKNNDHTKLQYHDDSSQLVLTVGKKEFTHSEHQDVFLKTDHNAWLRAFDRELEAFDKQLHEYPITFPPSYPFEESVKAATSYMHTRCPAWCDRVLLSTTAKQLISDEFPVEYDLLGSNSCMGDHKPVYLRLDLIGNSGRLQCCSHPSDCSLYPVVTPLPHPPSCVCCNNYAASVTINVVDLSDDNDMYINNCRSTVDAHLLREPYDAHRDEPYTPESSDSRSPRDDTDDVYVYPNRIDYDRHYNLDILSSQRDSGRNIDRNVSRDVDVFAKYTDKNLLHEPIGVTRDDPYTPESIESHSPFPVTENDENLPSSDSDYNSLTQQHASVSPEMLKSRLEIILSSPKNECVIIDDESTSSQQLNDDLMFSDDLNTNSDTFLPNFDESDKTKTHLDTNTKLEPVLRKCNLIKRSDSFSAILNSIKSKISHRRSKSLNKNKLEDNSKGSKLRNSYPDISTTMPIDDRTLKMSTKTDIFNTWVHSNISDIKNFLTSENKSSENFIENNYFEDRSVKQDVYSAIISDQNSDSRKETSCNKMTIPFSKKIHLGISEKVTSDTLKCVENKISDFERNISIKDGTNRPNEESRSFENTQSLMSLVPVQNSNDKNSIQLEKRSRKKRNSSVNNFKRKRKLCFCCLL